MKERLSRAGAVRHISAIGAGVLLAATPHCGGKSEETSDDSARGGASGSAGTIDGYGGFVGLPAGGYGGSYGGSIGTGGTGVGGYGGIVGIPSGGSAGCPSYVETRCFTPEELLGCLVVDGGIDSGLPDTGIDSGLPDTGIGGTNGTGEGGMAGEASEAEASNPPRTIIREAGIAPPEILCPASERLPSCVASLVPPASGLIATIGWNGEACCYAFAPYCY